MTIDRVTTREGIDRFSQRLQSWKFIKVSVVVSRQRLNSLYIRKHRNEEIRIGSVFQESGPGETYPLPHSVLNPSSLGKVMVSSRFTGYSSDGSCSH
jgi:hypothetical protein